MDIIERLHIELEEAIACDMDLDYEKILNHVESSVNRSGSNKWVQIGYVSIINVFEGKIYERVFAWRYKYKREKLRIWECIRRMDGSDKMYTRSLNNNGNGITWYYGSPELWKLKSYYDYPMEKPEELFSHDIISSLDPTLKYCAYPGNSKVSNVIHYIKYYRENPMIEMLSKLDILNLANYKLLLKRIKKDKKFVKWLYNNANDISKNSTYNWLLNAFKNGRSYKEQKEVDKFERLVRGIGLANSSFSNKMKRVFKYIDEQKRTLDYYFDYVGMALKFILLDDFLSNTKNLYPYSLVERHDYFLGLYNERKAAEEATRLKAKGVKFSEVASKYKKLNYSNKDYLIRVATSIDEIILEGLNLKHCVAGDTYINRFINDTSIILFCRKITDPDISYVTVELKTNDFEVNQMHGYENDEDKPLSEEVELFINNWAEMIRKKYKNKKKVAA